MNEILWVAVPGGKVVNGRATLRALCVPKLDTAAPQPLSAFGLLDWPATLAASTLTIERAHDANGAVSPVGGVTLSPQASSDVWRSFFGATTIVNPRAQRTYDAPSVDPTSTHAAKVTGNYKESAVAYATAAADPNLDVGAVVRGQYTQWADDAPADAQPGAIGPEDWQTPDFHRTVAFLREHPAVLKQLGLILEFSLAPDADWLTADGPQLIRLQCELGGNLPGEWDMVTPWTQFEFDEVHFVPAPKAGSDVRLGMVDLTGIKKTEAGAAAAASKTWSVVTFDVDAAVGRLRDGARSGGSSTDSPEGVSLPVLQSVGLTLLRHGRDELMKKQAETRHQNAGVSVSDRDPLTADELMLGYRVDIREGSTEGQTGEWFPLCARKATYTIGDRTIVAAQPEEGQVKANAAVIGTDMTMRANEILARWFGWSLVLPRPVFDHNGLRPSQATRPELPFDLDWTFTPSDLKMGRLRFGRGYQMRIRVADMAGGGLEFGDLPAGSNRDASDLILYRRHEPIAPPEFAPPKGAFMIGGGQLVTNPDALGPGGTIDCLVIRSDPKGDTPLDVEQFKIQHPDYPGNDSRILLPPPSSMSVAEQHGRFDDEVDDDGNPIDDATTLGWAQRAMAPPVATEDGDYNWLADPAAVSAMAFITDTADSPAPGEGTDSAWGPRWPDFDSKSLKLIPRTTAGDPVIEWASDGAAAAARNQLIVRLRPGEQCVLEISSRPDAQRIDEFEIKEWVPNAAETLVAEGRHPMTTPPRTVLLVHAVCKPMKKPAAALRVDRDVDATWAALADPGQPLFGVDRKSTGQVDVAARWREVGDREYTEDDPAPMVEEEVASLPVAVDADELSIFHQFADTRHRRVTYTLTALSRFRQFFNTGSDEDFQSGTTLTEVRIPSSARPPAPVVLAVSPSFRWDGSADLSAGPVARRRLCGRLRVEVARPWNASGEEERLAVVIASPGAVTEPPGGLTRISRDPIWDTTAAAGLAQGAMFAGAASDIAECLLAAADGGSEVKVLAVPYAAHFDASTERWYADVELPAAAAGSYSPLVRLVVARYQKESLPGCELSPTATTDFVPLMPDRTLSVQRVDGNLQILLQGLAPVGPRQNRVAAVIEQCTTQPGVDLSDLTSASPDLPGVWHRVGSSASGTLNAPLPPLAVPAAEGLLRLVVREIEDIEPAVPGAGGDSFADELRQRTVFVDVVRL